MWGLFAIDSGPRQTLQSLAEKSSFEWINKDINNSIFPEDFSFTDINGIVIGTSRSNLGISLEAQCRIKAKKLGLPLVAIEDYPGNYLHLSEGEVDLLIVESSLAEFAVSQKLGIYCPPTSVGASFRYDYLRKKNKYNELLKNNNSREILWLGQPETQDALRSLSRLLPFVKDLNMSLFFRAHPRDTGYKSGSYAQLFTKYSEFINDVSELNSEAVFQLNPCLSVTHFSSMSIELAFCGIPSMHFLFPDSGGATFKKLTGYDTPCVCKAGGSIAISNQEELEVLLPLQIFDMPSRTRMMQSFDVYMDIRTTQVDKVLNKLASFSN